MRVRKRSFRKFARPRRNDREKSRLLDRVAAVQFGGLHGPAYPHPQLKRDRALMLLTLSEPAANLSPSHCPPLDWKPMAEDEETTTARYAITLYETA